jgi:hypothetical protein
MPFDSPRLFTSVEELRVEIRRYIEAHNANAAKPLRWTKCAGSIWSR